LTSNGRAEPHLLVVIGATGDLAQRKLLPAFYRLDVDAKRPEPNAILAVARAKPPRS
jgi:glucose-6-phosphate 1-dehydrogenase